MSVLWEPLGPWRVTRFFRRWCRFWQVFKILSRVQPLVSSYLGDCRYSLQGFIFFLCSFLTLMGSTSFRLRAWRVLAEPDQMNLYLIIIREIVKLCLTSRAIDEANFEASKCLFVQERKSNPKSKFWGRISCGRPRGYPGGRPGAKTSVRHSKSWNNKHFGADVHDPKARTSMTPGGFKKTSVRKTSGWIFVPYLWSLKIGTIRPFKDQTLIISWIAPPHPHRPLCSLSATNRNPYPWVCECTPICHFGALSWVSRTKDWLSACTFCEMVIAIKSGNLAFLPPWKSIPRLDQKMVDNRAIF